MNELLYSLTFSLATGIFSSILVVFYFEYRDRKNYLISQAYILQRFIRDLFRTLTIIRVAVGFKYPQSSHQKEVLKGLEETLGRDNPIILSNKLGSLTEKEHRYIMGQLLEVQSSLLFLFSDSVAHRTIGGKVPASIAEFERWVNSVLQYYITYPEIIEGKADQMLHVIWLTSMINLIENTFVILTEMLKFQESDIDLRWTNRS